MKKVILVIGSFVLLGLASCSEKVDPVMVEETIQEQEAVDVLNQKIEDIDEAEIELDEAMLDLDEALEDL